jgi:hypothetical protein
MTVTIELPSDIEAGLLAQAQAEGLDVSDYVQHLVVEKVAGKLGANSGTRPAYELPPEEWIRKFNAWTESHAALNLPLLSDEDISRESIYRERGL